ncbi:peptidyl-tRNA hydrolase, mitochondrial isoform X1 [Zea mays]|uniref:Peptidyl-tRNA hydrolase chloroplastic n=1 Tax=Zea mays TaxID=4577 RepID=A0A1D6MBS1_MAIZE|nr:peptidyl-tRNA hydrolase, mitochondrial isoform X1 [Zea mays]AQK88206.1 Peptidyl-tRNA hydrolase chloroplastic [Zea mays]|eukprot:XP_008649963.1 peptidyl-tRNA hydrolase, mitochondrial isoform X1 [Zea mays]
MRLFSGVLDSSSALASAVLGSVSDRLGFSRIVFGRASPSNMPALACSAASSSSAATGAQKPWLFVGLGNPGRMYKGTRHNVGFEMIDAIAEAEGISVSSKQFKAIVGKGLIGDVPVMLAKPQTFMNASGESVGQLVSYFKIPLNQLVVIYDDLDLPFAKLRLLPKGGHGGHNGMRSIVDHLNQSRDFGRLRIGIGIGRPPEELGAINFVLRSFTKQEKEELEVTFQRSLQAVRIMVREGFNKSAQFVNTPQPPEMLNR